MVNFILRQSLRGGVLSIVDEGKAPPLFSEAACDGLLFLQVSRCGTRMTGFVTVWSILLRSDW